MVVQTRYAEAVSPFTICKIIAQESVQASNACFRDFGIFALIQVVFTFAFMALYLPVEVNLFLHFNVPSEDLPLGEGLM